MQVYRVKAIHETGSGLRPEKNTFPGGSGIPQNRGKIRQCQQDADDEEQSPLDAAAIADNRIKAEEQADYYAEKFEIVQKNIHILNTKTEIHSPGRNGRVAKKTIIS